MMISLDPRLLHLLHYSEKLLPNPSLAIVVVQQMPPLYQFVLELIIVVMVVIVLVIELIMIVIVI
jgi:hypothetical protein